jgi:hypothetical protein
VDRFCASRPASYCRLTVVISAISRASATFLKSLPRVRVRSKAPLPPPRLKI